MFTNDLSTLKIHKLSQAQYERELAAGNVDSNALYLTPDEEIDLSVYETKADAEAKYDELMQNKAPAFSPVEKISLTNHLYLTPEHQGKLLVISVPSNAQLMVVADEQSVLPVGFECEVLRYTTGRLCVAVAGNKSLLSTADTGMGYVELNERYSLAILKKISESEWLVGGDLK